MATRDTLLVPAKNLFTRRDNTILQHRLSPRACQQPASRGHVVEILYTRHGHIYATQGERVTCVSRGVTTHTLRCVDAADPSWGCGLHRPSRSLTACSLAVVEFRIEADARYPWRALQPCAWPFSRRPPAGTLSSPRPSSTREVAAWPPSKCLQRLRASENIPSCVKRSRHQPASHPSRTPGEWTATRPSMICAHLRRAPVVRSIPALLLHTWYSEGAMVIVGSGLSDIVRAC